ncbi:MAG: hypothetical protein ACLSA2_08430 [Candidatus Gastranaerophilaceae bacterium]
MPATDVNIQTSQVQSLQSVKKLVDSIFGYPGGIVLNVYDELFK